MTICFARKYAKIREAAIFVWYKNGHYQLNSINTERASQVHSHDCCSQILQRTLITVSNGTNQKICPGNYLHYQIGLQRYTGVPVHCNRFCHDTDIIVYWTSYRNIYDTFTYASTNVEKHCLLVLTLLLFSPYVLRFSEQTDEKNPCWAVFSVQDCGHNKCMRHSN